MKSAMAFVCAALGAALAACASTAAQEGGRVPQHASATCILLELGKDASLGDQLDEQLRPALESIATRPFAPSGYRCGDVVYQTDPRQLGLTYVAIGFSPDQRAASLVMQSVAGPLAGSGYRCLYQRTADGWALRGCRMDWIS